MSTCCMNSKKYGQQDLLLNLGADRGRDRGDTIPAMYEIQHKTQALVRRRRLRHAGAPHAPNGRSEYLYYSPIRGVILEPRGCPNGGALLTKHTHGVSTCFRPTNVERGGKRERIQQYKNRKTPSKISRVKQSTSRGCLQLWHKTMHDKDWFT